MACSDTSLLLLQRPQGDGDWGEQAYFYNSAKEKKTSFFFFWSAEGKDLFCVIIAWS